MHSLKLALSESLKTCTALLGEKAACCVHTCDLLLLLLLLLMLMRLYLLRAVACSNDTLAQCGVMRTNVCSDLVHVCEPTVKP